MSEEITKEIVELEVKHKWRCDAVAQDYAKRLCFIIDAFGIYHAARTYRPRITFKERLQFFWDSSKFLLEARLFSGKWFEKDNFMIGRHQYCDWEEWYGATFVDYHVYEDCIDVLCVREVHCSDGWLTYKLKHLGPITSDLVQRLLILSGQAKQELRKQREPEIQELEQQMARLKIVAMVNKNESKIT